MTPETVHLPVVTLIQPWATWIMLGWKTIESRTHNNFARLVGQRIGIHAGKKLIPYLQHIPSIHPYLSNDQYSEARSWHADNSHPLGAIIATAMVQSSRRLYPQDSKAALFTITEPGLYGLFLTDVRDIKPIWMSGKQGIWYYDGPAPIPTEKKQ